MKFNPLFATCLIALLLGYAHPWLAAQTTGSPDPASSDKAQSWSSTGQQQSPSGNLNPTRSSEVHTEANGRTTDKQSVERLGMDGQYVPYLDTEKESVQVDATTTRTIERTFGRDPDGQKTLVQVTEEEKRTLPGGEQKVVRTTSNPDANGRLQVIQREIQDTRQTSSNAQQTMTTILRPDLNGGFTPSMKIEDRQTRSNEHAVEFKKSTMLPDGNGNWQLQEVREGIIKEDGQERTKDERVLRPNADGQLAVVERAVTKESATPSGEGRKTVETYSTSLPGSADDSLRLNQRVTTVHRKTNQGGSVTEEQIEQRNPGMPGDNPRPTQKTIDIIRPSVGRGTEQQRTTVSLDPNGGSGAVWVDTRKGNKSAAVQVDTRKADAAPAANGDKQSSAKPQ